MITLNELKEFFEEMFDRELDTALLSEKTTLTDDLGMNSIAMLQMSLALEERYDIEFENSDFTRLKNVGDVIALINSKL